MLDFDSRGRVVVANVGDGEIFLSHVSIRSAEDKPRFSDAKEISEVLSSAEIMSKNLEEHDRQFKVVAGVNPKEWGVILKRAFTTNDECFQRRVLLEDGSGHTHLRDFLGDKLQTFAVEAEVHFYSPVQDKKLSHKFPAVGIVAVGKEEACIEAMDHLTKRSIDSITIKIQFPADLDER